MGERVYPGLPPRVLCLGWLPARLYGNSADTTPLPRLGLHDLQPVLASSPAGSQAERVRWLLMPLPACSLAPPEAVQRANDLPWRKVRA
jgi:hypothetical protein